MWVPMPCPIPGCDKTHPLVQRRASRPTVDLSADSALGKREREVPGRRSSEVPEPIRALAGQRSRHDGPHLPPSVPVTGTRSTQPAAASVVIPMPATTSPTAPAVSPEGEPRAVRSPGHSRASIPVEVRTRRRLSPVGGE